jgi:nucleotide-binding universal stress UspA family protein
MTYASIITQVQCDAEASPRLACAVDTALRFNAALIGVGAEMIPPLAFDSGFYAIEAQWVSAMRQSLDERLKLAQRSFTEATRELGARATWYSGIQLPAPAIAAASRAADLIVAGGVTHPGDSYCVAPPVELALISGRPVLIAPSKGKALSATTVLLAWKDTREARRALSDSLPFLTEAEQVEVLEVCHADDAEDAQFRVDDVVAGLRRHGVKAVAKVLVEGAANGFHLIARAKEIGADLIVAGAYGHSRLGEWIFGGVTADLLSQDELHLLLSH